MLVISRRKGESFYVGDDIEIIVSDVGSDKVKICINAPIGVKILRKELLETSDLNIEASTPPSKDILGGLGRLIK